MKTINLTFEDFRKENMTGETVKAIIQEYNGGKYGRMGEYVAIIKPCFFKNGKIIRSQFEVVETLETLKKGYRYGNATYSERIGTIIIED